MSVAICPNKNDGVKTAQRYDLWLGNVVSDGVNWHHITKSQMEGFYWKNVIDMNLLFNNNKFLSWTNFLIFCIFSRLDPWHHLWALQTRHHHSCSDKSPLTPHHIFASFFYLILAKSKKFNARIDTWFCVLCQNGG